MLANNNHLNNNKIIKINSVLLMVLAMTKIFRISDLQPISHHQGQRYSSLVDFIGESRTRFDGSPLYEFKICGALTVKIYTGNLLRTDSVDAIVCSVNDKLQGGFAAAVAKAAGQAYKQDLFNAARYIEIIRSMH